MNHDFGTVKEEDKTAEHSFKFKNISGSPIKLTYVRASCGCTTPKWTTDIIQPNATGEVTAVYGTTGRPGSFSKSVTVKAQKVNGKSGEVDSTGVDTKVLMINGNVTPKPAEAAPGNH